MSEGRSKPAAVDSGQCLDALTDFICGTRLQDVPDAVLADTGAIFADTLAVIAAGMQTAEMRALLPLHAPLAAPGAACVIGSGRRLNPLDAASLNGTAGVFLELDAGNARSHGHPVIHCLPSALAIAQETGASGADTLLACVVGYEVCARVGGAAKMGIMVQPHGTYGVLGAAVAVAKLKGLSRPQVRTLINVAAATPLGGNRQTMLDGATVRNWYAGHSSHMGQMAVRLTEAGFTGPHAALDVTFGKVLGTAFDSAQAIDGLGRDWYAGEGYIKLYSGARHLHSAIDALRDLWERHPGASFTPDDVASIDIRAHRLAAFCGEKVVPNAFGARFSVPFAVATVLAHRRWDLDCFNEAAVVNPVVRELMLKVDLREEPDFTRVYPEKQRCVLGVVLKNGTRLEGRCEIMRGEPENPNPPEAIEKKFFDLGTPVWGDALAARVYADSRRLTNVANMRDFAGGADL
ncbi:MAG: MmgE/PrpD family protein [Burkholderiales bacterium]